MNDSPPQDPRNVVLVAKHDGKEVGRKAATDPTATRWIEDLARQYKGVAVEYLNDPEEANTLRTVASLFTPPISGLPASFFRVTGASTPPTRGPMPDLSVFMAGPFVAAVEPAFAPVFNWHCVACGQDHSTDNSEVPEECPHCHEKGHVA